MKTHHHSRSNCLIRIWIMLLCLGLVVGASTAQAATHTVTSTADVGAGTLRSLIDTAASGDIITFSPTLEDKPISLASELVIDKNLTIQSIGTLRMLNALGRSRVFRVTKRSTRSLIAGIIIAEGWSQDQPGGGIFNEGTLVLNKCVVSENRVRGCSSGGGAGIYNSGTLIAQDTTIAGNIVFQEAPGAISSETGGSGGGVYNIGNANFERCFIHNNKACDSPLTYIENPSSGGSGGGVYNRGTASFSSCTIAGNFCGEGANNSGENLGPDGSRGGSGGDGGSGGGIFSTGTLSLTNSTVVGNRAGSGGGGGKGGRGGVFPGEPTGPGGPGGAGGKGGGIYATGRVILVHCTITSNSSASGGGGGAPGEPNATSVGLGSPGPKGSDGTGGGLAGQANLRNTIVANNSSATSASEVSGTFRSLGHNLISTAQGSTGFDSEGDLLEINARLGPLVDNGGPTPTCALLAGSPAIDAGPSSLPNAWQITDLSSAAGGLFFTNTLSAAQKMAATNDGWHFTVVSRLVEGSSGVGPAQFMGYGHGDRRFVVGWDLDPSGRLTARFYGAGGNFNGIVTPLTDAGEGVNTYHQHELVYSPVTRAATYLLDGEPMFTWEGLAPNADYNGQAFFGAAAGSGRGRMNYHHVRFAIIGQGAVSDYFAGNSGNPALAPDPTSQGWTRTWSVPTSTTVTNGPVSPDAVVPTPGLLYDQRGFARVANQRMDIGAYEVQQPEARHLRIRPQGVYVTIQSEPNDRLAIEWNIEANATGWRSLATGLADATGMLEVIDPSPQVARRFYRAVRQ